MVDCLLPLIENIRLVDRLAASAAAEERQKIARDVHDSVIQPYIALELGLDALLRQAEAAGQERDDDARTALLAGLQSQLRRINELMHSGVAELRGFVSRLRADGEREGSFAGIVTSYARRFAEITGISVRVEIEATSELDANDRLCAEVFQMIAEGLSNVRRHSEGKLATVRISQSEQELHVSIQNDGTPGPSAAFVLAALDRRSRPFAAGLGEGRAAARGRLHRDGRDPAVKPDADADLRGEATAIGILLVDDHPLVREGVRMLVESQEDMELLGESADRAGALAAVRVLRPDLVPAGPRSRRRQRARPAPRTDRGESGSTRARVHRLARSGAVSARGGARRTRRRAEGTSRVPCCWPRSARSTPVKPGSIARRSASLLQDARRALHQRDPEQQRITELTAREREIVALVAQGHGTRQLSARLGIADKTIRNHLVSIYAKLGVSDRLELAIYAGRHGLADPVERSGR